MVSGLTGAFAAAMPALLLWPRLGQRVYGDPRLPYLLTEMGVVGGLVLLTQLGRASASAVLAWAACGVTAMFAAMSGPTVGSLFVPASVLFALSGLLADLPRPRVLPVRLLTAAGAALAQAAIMAVM